MADSKVSLESALAVVEDSSSMVTGCAVFGRVGDDGRERVSYSASRW